MISELIDKQDAFEIIRDKIAVILATESASQVALATSAGEPDPTLWNLEVYIERSNPWEKWLNVDSASITASDLIPIVNVWFDNSSPDLSASNVVRDQQMRGTFNVDCYGFAISEDDGGAGHLPGDREAVFACQRAVRLCRNILMAGEYTYLGLRGVVGQRMPQSITMMQTGADNSNVLQAVAARFALDVVYEENSPQIVGTEIDEIFVDVSRTGDGKLVVEADYVY